MKKIGLFFALLLTISFQINAQWFLHNQKPQGSILSAVDFVSDNNGIESVEEDTVKIDPYLFPGEVKAWGRWQEIYFEGLTAPLQASVNVTFNGTATDITNTNPLKFKLNVEENNTGGMYQIIVNITDANNVERQIIRDVEIIENSNPYPALESGVPLKGKISTRKDIEGSIQYECVPAEWVVRYNKLDNYNLTDYIAGDDIIELGFSAMNADLTGPGNTIYIKYAPNATDKLMVLSIGDKEAMQTPSGGGRIRSWRCQVPTLIELEDSILATMLNLNLGRVPIGNTVITSFNSGSESDVTLKNVNTGSVLDFKHIPFVDFIQDEILIKPEYAEGNTDYVPLSYTVDNGHSQIVFSIEAFDPTTVGVDDEINLLNEFKVDQNYPNPFNPVTKIKYSVPQRSFVTLKVFDLLGKEIAILVNEEKSIGNYEIEFNGSNLSSGVYLYKLQTRDFTDTKKLILLK